MLIERDRAPVSSSPQGPGRHIPRIGRAVLMATVAAIVVVGAIIVLDNRAGDDPGGPTIGSTSPTNTTEPPVSGDERDIAMWPRVDVGAIYDDPVEAAAGFATELVGFVKPIIGDFAGDSGSGTVAIRPTENGPVTTVKVRRLGDERTWWVTGASTESIVVNRPVELESIETPALLRGQARAFEGTVNVALLTDESSTPIATTIVTGRGDGVLGPFSGELSWSGDQTGLRGTVLFLTHSAMDGSVWEAAAVRVELG